MSDRSVAAGTPGEHQNGRAAMDNLIKRQVAEGVPANVATERARQTALRMDRKNNGKG